MRAIGLEPQTGLALTGVKGRLKGKTPARASPSSANWTACAFDGHRHGDDDPCRLARPDVEALLYRRTARTAPSSSRSLFRRASHAGGAPQLGINALSAAMLALNAIHAQREKLLGQGHGLHPSDHHQGRRRGQRRAAEVHMETFVRGGSREAIIDANLKVDRCLRAGALAMGAEVQINTIPGYLPQKNDRSMGELFGANVEAMFGAGSFDIGGHRTGSTDMATSPI